MARFGAMFLLVLVLFAMLLASAPVAEAKVKHVHHGRPNFSNWVSKYSKAHQRHAFKVHRSKPAKVVPDHLKPIPQPKMTKERIAATGHHHNTLGMWKGANPNA